ncbi:hypothetical protein MKW94_027446 [Papaver nudicaule]|uniref:Protein kinase domain-containing protein n=1 Tax=Papaver nudicaule TaxID=74823 RepID=A0AA41VLX9_PAPNU|nr:hypothetical protein [Papaver nudicaule]
MAIPSHECFLFPFIIFNIFFPTVNSISFNITRSEDWNNILLEGDAKALNGSIELINEFTYTSRVGRATYAEPVRLWDSSTGEVTDFSTHFTFSIDTLNRSVYSAGLAFFIAPVGNPIPQNSGSGFLGLFNTTTSDISSLNQIIHVEFDMFANPDWDPDFEHVGINHNSIRSAVVLPWNASLHSQETGNAWITYSAATKNLSVYWTYDKNPVYRGDSLLSYQVDLKQALPEWVTVGFSAATGMYTGRFTFSSWDFSSPLEVHTKKVEKEKINVKLVVGLLVPVIILVTSVVAIAVVWLMWLDKRRARKEQDEFTSYLEGGAVPKRFLLKELVSATNNFSEERKLGEGGFGGVYRGFMSDTGLEIAVKKISTGSRQGQKEYISEVKIISRLRHRNLVQLIGWCHESGGFQLVYELMPNGSLDSHLFGQRSPLSWAVRFKIALGLASALLYLHEEGEQCIIHRDVKSSNIMLDLNFNAKLGDFGLARLADHERGPQTTVLAGTLGYLAPECLNTGKASKESDVFSFGVVALEISCGRKAFDRVDEDSRAGLVEWVWNHYGSGGLLAAVDDKLSLEFDAKQAECLMIVGLWCAHPDPNFRPPIRQAIQVLIMEANVPNLPTRMPVPLYHVPELSVNFSGATSISNTGIDVGR